MCDFCPMPWPEDSTPEEFRGCTECGLDKHGSRMVWGEGNPNAPIMIILDNPGSREDKEGNEFVCGTRLTLHQAIHDAGLIAEDLYLTFILKRRPTRSYDKTEVRRICINHLYDQLEKMQPKFIICLGNVAVQSFFQDPEAEVKSLRGTIHHVRGFPTCVAYHPLAVRRRPNLKALLLEDLAFAAEHYQNSLLNE